MNAAKGWLTFLVNCILVLFLIAICMMNAFISEEQNLLCSFLRGNDKDLICLSLIIYSFYQISYHMQRFSLLIVDSTLSFDTWTIVQDFQKNIIDEAAYEEQNHNNLPEESWYDVKFLDISVSFRHCQKIIEDLSLTVDAKEKMGMYNIGKI